MPKRAPEANETSGAARALREQSLGALRELFSALVRADERAAGELLRGQEDIHGALVRLLLRMVVLLFAEARGLLPAAAGESLFDLYARLAADAAQEGAAFAAMTGAFSRLLSRLDALSGEAHADPDGGGLFDAALPPLFAPDAPLASHIADPVVLRVFEKLLFIGGARLGYESLDVELLGSVYEGLLGTTVEVTRGESLALAPDDVVVCLDDLLVLPDDARIAWLKGAANVSLRGPAALAVGAARTTAELFLALAKRVSPRQPALLPAGAFLLLPAADRRRLGAFYTSRALTRVMVERTLAPLLPEGASPEAILSLTVCDPAMGSGAFLVEVCRYLTARLVSAEPRVGGEGEDSEMFAAQRIAGACLYGVDKNPLARDLARASLFLWTRAPGHPASFLARALRHGDSLVGAPLAGGRASVPFPWALEFSAIFTRGGFDAFVGNPPWVSYAGRAAQPLEPELRRYYSETNPAFAGYRNLQALFVRRAAEMLRPGGRLGFVLPTSMSDLGGYEPSRRAHDALAICDDELPDFGDAFDDVFQPSMGLLSTRRETPLLLERAGAWPLARGDLDGAAKALVARLASLPVLPARLFGERGFQTTGADVSKLHPQDAPLGKRAVGVRVGGDIEPFSRRAPRLYCDPADFDRRFRGEDEWKTVRLFIRQTARFPMAALSDGGAFRNSILAGFSDDTFSAFFLVAWLNAAPIRFYHYMRQRDARQGMPQVKIAHLRAIPAPMSPAPSAAIEALGRALGEKNRGATPAEQEELDALVALALGFTEAERALVATWSARFSLRKAAASETGPGELGPACATIAEERATELDV